MLHRCSLIVFTLYTQMELSRQYMNFNSLETYNLYGALDKENYRMPNSFLRENNERNSDNVDDTHDLPEEIEQEGVMHFRMVKEAEEKIAQDLDNSFRDLISMKDVSYTYKRGIFWRTWRELEKDNGTKVLVSYSCKGFDKVNTNKMSCSNGLWEIDEKTPLCPFEIFSMETDFLFCGINHMNLTKDIYGKECPEIIRLTELSGVCDNPIVTAYRFENNYKNFKSGHQSTNIIAEGHGKFNLTSIYKIKEDRIVFTLINSTGNVIYSKIMMPNNKNYFCIDNCGSLVPNTTTIKRYVNIDYDDYSSELQDYEEEVTAKTFVLNFKDVNSDDEETESQNSGHVMKIRNVITTTEIPVTDVVTVSQCKQLLMARIVPDDFE